MGRDYTPTKRCRDCGKRAASRMEDGATIRTGDTTAWMERYECCSKCGARRSAYPSHLSPVVDGEPSPLLIPLIMRAA